MSASMMAGHDTTVLGTIYGRRAVRSYMPDQIEDDVVHTLLDAAVHAPTAMHLEPWAFVVIQDDATLHWLSDRSKALVVAQSTEHGDLLKAPGAAPANRHVAMLSDPAFNIFYDAGTLIVICAKPLGAFVVADCWLAAENLMLAAYSLGLGTCCIGFALPALNTPDVKQTLGIPAELTPIAPIIVGAPRGGTPPVPRKEPDIVRWIYPATGQRAAG